MSWIIKHAEPFPSIDPSIEGDDYETLYWSNEDGWGLGNPTIFTDQEKETLNLPMGGVWEMQEDTMAKFDVTILYTVTYTHNIEIEADTEAGAEAKANEIFKNADPIAHWEYDSGELDMDIWEVEDGQ